MTTDHARDGGGRFAPTGRRSQQQASDEREAARSALREADEASHPRPTSGVAIRQGSLAQHVSVDGSEVGLVLQEKPDSWRAANGSGAIGRYPTLDAAAQALAEASNATQDVENPE